MKSQARIRYEIDPHNRLIVKKAGRKSGVARHRRVLDGKFSIGERNYLIYHLKKSAAIDMPQQIKLSGDWSLDEEHNLVFTLDKWGNQIEGDRLTIKGGIIDAASNELVFTVISKNPSGGDEIYLLKLSGAWQADRYNRLVFNVERAKGLADRLTLEGAWEVNKQNQLIYSYTKTKTVFRRRVKTLNVITLKGYWDIAKRNRITYILNKKLGSELEFRVMVGNVFKNAIVYNIGFGVIPEKKIILIPGAWRLNRRLGLLFEIEYADNKLRSIVFGAQVKLNKGNNLDLKLTNRSNESLGLEITLSRDLLVGGQAFLKALTSKKEASIIAGVGFGW